ncbi:hypothetical protein N9L06_05140 [Mariniblastus sp.]|nr:hypothetical protein [Mariniblastus sp.]
MIDSFTIDPSVLAFLRCPVTQSELTTADDGLVQQANALIESSQLTDRLGQSVPGPIEAAFVNADQSLLIPVRGGIVVMLEDRLIPMSQLNRDD